MSEFSPKDIIFGRSWFGKLCNIIASKNNLTRLLYLVREVHTEHGLDQVLATNSANIGDLLDKGWHPLDITHRTETYNTTESVFINL